MPGLVGFVSRQVSDEARLRAQTMVASTKHEGYYVQGFHIDEATGLYLGWTSHPESSVESNLFTNAERTISLLLVGEFHDSGAASLPAAESFGGRHGPASWLVSAYMRADFHFLPSLNGLFSGLLIDRRRNEVHLFNDRYGAERLYVYETKDAVYFASEAKAILSVVPETRTFDSEGLAQHLAFGCAVGERTLFNGIRILPGGSHWTFQRGVCTKRRYFSPAGWEQQTRLSPVEFESALRSVLTRIVPRYARTQRRIGMSLTAGLDTRMVMASLGRIPPNMVAFTYSGEDVDPLDARLAARIAQACGLEHHSLRIGADFFQGFAKLADETVYITDGNFGVFGSHEIYMSRQARALAPLRLTGNYGSEILRGVSTFKPAQHLPGVLQPGLLAAVQAAGRHPDLQNTHPITFAAFKETPWNLFGNLAAGRSQLGFRTPYLDNEFVELAYRCPDSPSATREVCIDLVRACSPALAAIPTDKGFLGNASRWTRGLRYAWGRATFKLDYINNEGFPNAFTPIEPLFQNTMKRLGLLGLHKHLHYRSWIRSKLSKYILERLTDPSLRHSTVWNYPMVERIAHEHVSGKKNHVNQIGAVLTHQAIERLLIKGSATYGRLQPVGTHLTPTPTFRT